MLKFTRLLSSAESPPFDFFEWKREIITTTNDQGKVIGEHENVEFPDDWSVLSKRTVAQKYFRHSRAGNEKETSLKEMVTRVVSFITDAGLEKKYFNQENAQIFNDELTHLILRQMVTFNSPVWFNVGVPGVEKPQGSACFINEVEDDMNSILELVKTEGLIFILTLITLFVYLYISD